VKINNEKSGISRRIFLMNACLAACVLPGRSLYALDVGSSALVQTPSGPLRGESAGGVRVFRGVPFAEPPVGPLRFLPTVKIKPWAEVRDVTKFAAAPMQEGTLPVPQSEDCLTLNIWAPEGEGPFPVFVWIHGGGLTGGRASDPMYHGEAFAREGIICVTVAYRLGVFGFLDLEPLLGAQYAGTANNGVCDLVAGLEWVHENIAAFGGDPSRITVGGESAGAKLTGILMGVPSAQPYFHQMISESGGAERIVPSAKSTDVANGFGSTWRAQTGQDVSTLLTAPAASIIEAQHTFTANWAEHFPLRPEIDGTLLPRLPVQSITKGTTRGKRLLIGTNRDESALFIGPHPSKDPTAADLGNLPVEKFDDVYQHYKEIYPQLTDEQRRIRALTAEEYYIPSMRVIDAHLKGGGSAWMYRLDFVQTSGHLEGYAYHSLDVGLVWGHPNTEVANASDEAALAAQVSQAWAAFIRGDAPAAPGLPVWPRYRSDTRPTMILDTVSHVDEMPQETELRLWDGVL